MSNSPRPFRVVVVSPETDVLHDLAWMLAAVGYSVVTSRDTQDTAAWRRYSDADFLLFDGRSIANPTAATLAHASENPLYRIFLYDPAVRSELSAWFAAGANDGLRVPVSRGELLSRIRAGARVLEFERRMRTQSSRSKLPGVYSVRGLLRKLQAFSIEGQSITLGHTLLTTSIDFFAELARQEGRPAARALAATLAEVIRQSSGSDAIPAYRDDGTFHIVLPGKKLAAAREVADEIAQRFRAAQVEREPSDRLPVTTAVVPWLVGVHPEELLQQGQDTLAIARQSGGDCAVEQNAFAQELANWQSELTAGSPFGNVIAEDIMEPFPAVIDCEAPNEAMLAALRRSEAPVWPFVDREGKLVGVASPKSGVADAFKIGADSVVRKSLTMPVTIDHGAAFPEIYEAFSSQGCLTMVVVADERPVGYLTCNGFLSLIEPINSATFACEEPLADDSRALLVGSLAGDAEFSPA